MHWTLTRRWTLTGAAIALSMGGLAFGSATNLGPLRACVGAAVAQVDLIPRADLFAEPARTRVRISPDGSRLSFLARHRGVMNVWVQTVGADDARPATMSSERSIRHYYWAPNGEQILYIEPRGNDGGARLLAVDLATYSVIDLTPFPDVEPRIVAIDRDHPDDVLVAINNRAPDQHDVWRVNTRTGGREIVFENTEGYIGLQADSSLQIRLAARINRVGGLDIITRDAPDAEWYELVHWNLEDAASSKSLGISRDGTRIYLLDAREGETARLFAYTVGTGGEEVSYDLLAYDDRVDAGCIAFDPKSGRPQAVAFDFLRREWRVLDDAVREDWAALVGVTDGELSLTDRDRADRRWIVAYERDDGPRAYYLYDRDERRETFLFTDRPGLEDAPLLRMTPVTIRARDGLEMVSYLTLPAGRTLGEAPGSAAPPPMVLYVHGGPWSRDTWGFNPVHQWLANRGYAVLSVNYRGSTGFGKTFQSAGNGEWAGRMQDDLIDAVIWAVDRNVAHPDQVAIMGGSYGGYAALVGLTFTPDFFAAGIDIVGPSNVRTLLESIPTPWSPVRAMFEARIGSLDEPQFLDLISPLSRAEDIRRPLLIGQGSRDRRAKESESRRIVEAMQARGVPVTYVVFPDEGHGFRRPANSLAFFAIAEAFLARHVGGRFEAPGDSLRASSADIQAGADLMTGLTRE